MLKKTLIASGLVLTLAFVGCTTTNSSNTTENLAALQHKNWVLTHIGNVEYKVDPTAHNAPSLNFDNKALSGADGCNRIMGGYTVQGQKLSFSQLAKTQMMCMNTTDLADKYSKAMEHVTYYKVADQTLQLLDSDKKVVLQFKSN